MKKIAASVGLIVLGTTCVRAADEPFFSADAGKPWRISASLRGFYDDNINTVPDGAANKVDSFGYSLTPGIDFKIRRDQTTLDLSYRYSLIYYDVQRNGNDGNFDNTHTFNLELDHAFSERYKINVADSFVIGQEPYLLATGNDLTSATYVPGDNIRNWASVLFNAELTPVFGLELGYQNAFFDYEGSGPILIPGPSLIPSASGTSDRVEHTFHIDGRWNVLPTTTAFLGYQYGMGDYTGDELISLQPLVSNQRNWRAHYGYVGAEHTFNPDLEGKLRVGIRSTDYYNDPTSRSDLSPYVNLALTYRFLPESYVSAGFSYDRNSTDIISPAASGSPVTGQQSATFFANVNHRIVPNLYGTLRGQYQNSSFIGGSLDGETENYLLLGINLQYRFTQYFSAEVGYDYDKIDSDAGRSYDRNRVYVGITGSY